MSPGPGSISSGGGDEAEEDQLASDCTDEAEEEDQLASECTDEALVKVEASGAAKGKQEGKARCSKADSIYDPEIHVAWVAAVSRIFIHCRELFRLTPWLQCNICSKGNKACFGPAYARDKGTDNVRVASKRCVRCVVDHNVCRGGEFGYTVKFLDTYAPSDREGEPPAPTQPRHVVPAKRKASVGNVPTRARPYPRLDSPLNIGSSSQPNLRDSLQSFAFQLRQLRRSLDLLEEQFVTIFRDFA